MATLLLLPALGMCLHSNGFFVPIA
jgi:hypothetical protein